jgi:Leucine-rich repeat (LRR) protein
VIFRQRADCQCTQVPDLAPLTALRRLELSYNDIKSLRPLTSLSGQHLSDLYVASNNVSSVSRSITEH